MKSLFQLNGKRQRIFFIVRSYVSIPKPSQISNKTNLLTKLRRSTGYPIGKCQQALKMYEYDYEKAKVYLQEKAEKENWDKAAKLQFRTTKQGLIGTMVSNNGQVGIMVELNCETDFVTKNIKFGHLMELLLHSIQNFVFSTEFQASQNKTFDNSQNSLPLQKYTLESDILKTIPITFKESNESHHKIVKIQDSIAQAIGSFGENIAIKRAICMQYNSPLLPSKLNGDDINIMGYIGSYCHAINRLHLPDHVKYGKYGALVALNKSLSPNEKNQSQMDKKLHLNMEKLGQYMAQHVVGMNPKELGDLNNYQNFEDNQSQTTPLSDLTPKVVLPNLEEEGAKAEKNVLAVEEEYDADEFDKAFYQEYNEKLKAEEAMSREGRLLHQSYLLDPDKKIRDVLGENGMTIVDFVRYECGEETTENQKTPQIY